MLLANTIVTHHPDDFVYLRGDLDAVAESCQPPESASSASLVFFGDTDQVAAFATKRAAIAIVHESIAGDDLVVKACFGCVFSIRSIPLGMALLLKHFDQKRARFSQWGSRHPTAVIHPTAVVAECAVLGPYVVIGENCHVGERCSLGAHVALESAVQVGSGTVLHPHVFVGSGCIIGRDCEIHPHTSIGSDGFGYAPGGAEGRPRKIPQLGIVTLGDDVEIGSNCAIDRATLTSTYIRSGTKLDNLCHIAHNCDLGENGLYTAGFMMAGSTKIGRGFITGGNSVVGPHLTLADNVVLAGRSTVTNDVKESGQYGGYPLQPLKDALKTLVSVGQLNDIRRNLNKVMKTLGL